MKLKKSSGSKVAKASEEIAEKLGRKPKRSKKKTAGMVVGALAALGAVMWALTMMMGEDEMETMMGDEE